MADREAADQDLFRIWLESSRSFFAAGSAEPPMPDSLKEKCEGLFAAWNRFARTYAEAGSAGTEGGPFDPVGWLDVAGGGGFGDLWRWFGTPEGADLWREERDALTATRQWIAYAAALERYRAVMSAAWLRAFKRFTEELAQDSGPRDSGPRAAIKDGQPGDDGHPDWKLIQTRWQQAAEAEMSAALRSEEFLAAQRDLIRARLDCSALLRERIERFAAVLGLPTRAEIDSLHETVHGLERELRTLRGRLGGAT
ncbi:MAG TPA: poly(R)-hydroxyalkanoic acid synthase subunit PhaE [Kiloniellales bacterium]